MGTTVLIAALVALGTPSATISRASATHQETVFEELWDAPFVWEFDDLPTESSVPSFRLPYSGYIYPDKQGGTSSALSKYDRAFNRGRMLATGHEHWDTTAYKKPTKKRGLFGLGRTVMETPNWHGHCNGWAAATIRHAEPQQSVRFNGVVFTPADIKGLLAEIYIYNDLENLAGVKYAMNAGTFHAIIANWIGRGHHPIGVEADPGEEKWNYPVYAYASSSAKRSPRTVEVKLNLGYIKDSNGEYQESPHIQRYKYFHYQLDLDGSGNIIGGAYYSDSSRIDLLWIPRRPKRSGAKGNKPGNPFVSVDQVLAIWRASVPEEDRKKWLVIDPTPDDRVTQIADDVEGLVPIQVPGQSPRPTVIADTDSESNEIPTTDDAVADNSSSESTESVANTEDDAIADTMEVTEIPVEDREVEVSTPVANTSETHMEETPVDSDEPPAEENGEEEEASSSVACPAEDAGAEAQPSEPQSEADSASDPTEEPLPTEASETPPEQKVDAPDETPTEPATPPESGLNPPANAPTA